MLSHITQQVTEKGIKSQFCQIQDFLQEDLSVKHTYSKNSKEPTVKVKDKKAQTQEKWHLSLRLHKWALFP